MSEVLKWLLIVLAAVLAISCSGEGDRCVWSEFTVAQVFTESCTAGTGGWGGSAAKCRIEFESGERATVRRPVTAGDRYVGDCEGRVWPKGSYYAPIFAGLIKG